MHARLVLLHVPQRGRALTKIIASTKSGGWVMVEVFGIGIGRERLATIITLRESFPGCYTSVEKLIQARGKVMQSHGADQSYARRLYHLFRSRGLRGVQMEAFTATRPGGSKGGMRERANTLQA